VRLLVDSLPVSQHAPPKSGSTADNALESADAAAKSAAAARWSDPKLAAQALRTAPRVTSGQFHSTPSPGWSERFIQMA